MRCSIHIDAGYLYGALATRTTGSANRAAIKVIESALITELVAAATADSGLRLLRVLWYDAARDGIPDQHQKRIGLVDSVKLRMGRINPYGEQKGVDLRLGLDLVNLGVSRAAEVAYVISGDDDLTEAVEDAQNLGVQVKLMAVPDANGRPLSVAGNLSLAVDGILTIPASVIDLTVSRIVRPPAAVASAEPTEPTEPADAPESERPDDAKPTSHVVPKPRPSVIPPPVPAGAAPPARPAAPVPRPMPVYSTSSGMPGGQGWDRDIDPDLVEAIARSVYDVWATTAGDDERAAMLAGRPNIPPEIDRILLQDFVNRTGIYDIPTDSRYLLRDAFWVAVGGSHR